MLKLERKSRDGQVSVQFRDKEFIFNRTLWFALACALAYHFLFFVVFNVTPFKISVLTVFPLISVESDTLPKESAAIASDATAITSLHGIPFPKASTPPLPAHPQFLGMIPSEYIKESNVKDSPFYFVEAGAHLPEIAIPQRKAKNPVEVLVSGLLADKFVGNGDIDKQMLAALSRMPSPQDMRVVYNVRVEGKSGKVFWFEAKELTNNASIDALAESIVRNLAFAADASAFETDGEIELHFHPEAL